MKLKLNQKNIWLILILSRKQAKMIKNNYKNYKKKIKK